MISQSPSQPTILCDYISRFPKLSSVMSMSVRLNASSVYYWLLLIMYSERDKPNPTRLSRTAHATSLRTVGRSVPMVMLSRYY